MKVNLNAEVLDLNQKPILNETGSPITLKTVCIESIMIADSFQKMSGEEKLKNYALAERIFKTDGEIDLNIDEVKKIRDLTGIVWTTRVYGAIDKMLK